MSKVEDLVYGFLEFPLELDSFYKDADVIKYLEEIKKYKKLSKEEEQRLLVEKEYEKVFHANLFKVALIAGRYSLLTKSIYPMDLIQEANLGLLEAIKLYKSNLRTSFDQYIRIFVSKKLINMLKEQGNIFKVSPLEYEKIIDYIKLLELNELLDDGKFNKTLANAWGKFEDKHYKSDGFIDYKKMDRDIVNMQNAIEGVVSIETLDKRKPIGTYDIENDINTISIKLELLKAIKDTKLSQIERTILYYSFIDIRTVKDISSIVNLSLIQVRNIKEKSLIKLNGYLKTRNKLNGEENIKK